MSSPSTSSGRYAMPPPSTSRPGSSSGQAIGNTNGVVYADTPRSSFERGIGSRSSNGGHGTYIQQQGQGEGPSRRPSGGSHRDREYHHGVNNNNNYNNNIISQSPISTGSSSRHHQHYGPPEGVEYSSGGVGPRDGGGQQQWNNQSASSSSHHPPQQQPFSAVPHTASGQSQRGLPRITTSVPINDDSPGENGPRSAPLRPPSNGLVPRGDVPMRSSSSPDPWTRDYPVPPGANLSPTEARFPPPPHPTNLLNGPPPPLGAPFPVPYPRGHSPSNNSNNGSNSNHVPIRTSSIAVDVDRGGGSISQASDRSALETASNEQHGGSDAQSQSGSGSGSGRMAFPVPDIPKSREKEKDRGEKESTRQGRSRGDPTYCGQCGQVVHGQFVRAMGKVFHLNCFRCKDCDKVVAQKFFPVEDGDAMYPLCERDYFARLDLICAKCDQALRASYITACGVKFHVEHFACSECDTVFGPNDSYYEHEGKVYCPFHYCVRFAVKCVGCETAILKHFVEMNRNGRDECWHPECYMISKFWNVRLASKNFNTPANSAVSSAVSLMEMTPSGGLTTMTPGKSPLPSPGSTHDLSPEELQVRQDSMELKVLQIWHVLSGYEESSAALIGEMLRAVNSRNLLEIILLAERFILHVETLFAVVDDIEAQFALANVKGMSHAREAKQLCRKLVNLFSLMSQINPTSDPTPNNQELFNLITQLAHYLKIIIRIALTGSIKLERDQSKLTAMTNTLARLNLLSLDGGDPTVPKRGDFPEVEPAPKDPKKDGGGGGGAVTPNGAPDEEQLKRAMDSLTRRPEGYIPSTQHIAYGYRSLASEVTGETNLRGPADENYIPPEVCAACSKAIEEDCARLGMFNRWHSSCIQCVTCGDRALPLPTEEPEDTHSREDGIPVTTRPKRTPAQVDRFFYEPTSGTFEAPRSIYCVNHRTPSCKGGFETVSRLEQYAFLLHIAMRRLYVHFRMHYELPSVRDHGLDETGANLSGRDPDVKRMKSVTLDRKISSTARLPQRSMVVESPAGRMANENGQVVSTRSQLALTPHQVQSDIQVDTSIPPDEQAPQSATLDVIRPPFARNNTSVLIVNENSLEEPPIQQLTIATIQEDDAITLGDIPLLADQTIGQQSSRDGQILLSTLNPLQSLILRHFALLQLQKTGIGHLIELDDVLELLEARKSQWWNKLFKGPNKKDQKKKGVFGVPLEILIERTGSDSQQGASNAQLRVPEFIEDIISTMRQMDMAVEGIFRKNGNIRRLQQISEALDKDSTTVNLSEENPVQLAALLKRFLREMPDPLLTFRLHKLFCAATSLPNPDDRKRVIHLLVTLLPRYNRDTMEVLFVFLKWVASFSYRDEETGSKMDLANLATVICPSILYAKGANAARDESFIAINAVQELLENQDYYYVVPQELVFVIQENIYAIFAKELDLPPKEIHRHCSKYMQARGQPQFQPPPRVPASQSGQIRDRPSDSRLSVHRSEGNLANTGMPEPAVPQPIFRSIPSPSNQSRPGSWVQSMQSMPGSQQSLQHLANSPGSGAWRGPFQGSGNGSRNSSRGSVPSSPGPEERRSIQLERERTRTPIQQGDYR